MGQETQRRGATSLLHHIHNTIYTTRTWHMKLGMTRWNTEPLLRTSSNPPPTQQTPHAGRVVHCQVKHRWMGYVLSERLARDGRVALLAGAAHTTRTKFKTIWRCHLSNTGSGVFATGEWSVRGSGELQLFPTNAWPASCQRWESTHHSARKFSTVLGTALPYRPITMRPEGGRVIRG